MSSAAQRLRELLAGPDLVVVPGVTGAFYARLAEQAGFEAIFTTGAGIANTLLGVPDIGLTTMTEVVTITRHVVDAVSIPVIADADTGYGNHLNVVRTVKELERAGVAGLFIEDQVAPKRCGHFDRKRVVPVREMAEKIVAATMARENPDLVLIARTDAIAVEGLEAALERARCYVEAGADIIFVEAPRSIEEMARIPGAVAVPCMINLVEGGRTPILPATELAAMGFKLAVYANLALRTAAQAVERAFKVLREEGHSSSLIDEIFSWQKRQATVGLPEWERLDAEVAELTDERLKGHSSPVSSGDSKRQSTTAEPGAHARDARCSPGTPP